MRILVTGGTGIVGRATVPILRDRGHEVTVLTRDASRGSTHGYVHGDLADRAAIADLLADVRPDAVIHLAWDGLPDYSLPQTMKNFDASLSFFTLASQTGCQSIVSTGSCWEYASRHGQLNEDAVLSGAEPFHAAKSALRFLGQGLAHAHGVRFYWLRLFFVYGPGQRSQSLIPQVVDAIRDRRPVTLRAPYNRHDFVFVTDVARAIADVTEQRPPGTVYNVGSGHPTAVADVVSAVRRLLTTDPGPAIPVEPAQQDFWADISRLRADTGWAPRLNIEDGLRATLASVREVRT